MSCHENEYILEQKFEEGIYFGMSDDVAAAYAQAYLNGDSLEPFKQYAYQGVDVDLCLCGEQLHACEDAYVHMSKGY